MEPKEYRCSWSTRLAMWLFVAGLLYCAFAGISVYDSGMSLGEFFMVLFWVVACVGVAVPLVLASSTSYIISDEGLMRRRMQRQEQIRWDAIERVEWGYPAIRARYVGKGLFISTTRQGSWNVFFVQGLPEMKQIVVEKVGLIRTSSPPIRLDSNETYQRRSVEQHEVDEEGRVIITCKRCFIKMRLPRGHHGKVEIKCKCGGVSTALI